YCSAEVDALADKILVENDPDKRDALIAEAYTLSNNDVAHIPLHQQGLAWGVAEGVELAQRADNQFHFRFVTKN
ncbi:MAG: ABC transporter substrate-binding protein, partial [Roseibium sp.]